ncbi:MAG: hypothetical protein ACRDL6_00885, partial [Solirubrobacterales bacterium]
PGPQERPQRSAPPPPDPELRRIAVLDRFAVGVPDGWGGGTSGGAVVFRAPSLDGSLRIFLEPGTTGRARLYERAKGFISAEHPGAKVRRKARGRLGEHRAIRLAVNHESGKQWAALLTAGGYTYFVIAEAGDGAPRTVRAASVAALRSFRPL